ncbi:MAG: N-formylglutamate amidohydrolase [Acetobacteraceae bacterium]
MDHPMPLPSAERVDSVPAPYCVIEPAQQAAALVFASPHSGRNYPKNFLEAARLDAHALRRSEDSFVDELFAGATQAGAPLLTATFARAYCDPNREAWELDPAMFADALPAWVNTTSARVGAGLGTLARVVASGEAIYRRKLTFNEAEYRVHAYWEPYHRALQDLLARTRQRFGACLLIDCHSMPAQAGSVRGTADFVLGDAHGTACSSRITRAAELLLTAMGYTVRRNDPYAGGYVTRHYGRPRENTHALQIEVARTLYMDETRYLRGAGFPALQRDLTQLSLELARQSPDLLGV